VSLTNDELNAVRALWEEWTAGKGFRLSIEVLIESVDAELVRSRELMAHVKSDSRYCQVEIRKVTERDRRIARTYPAGVDPAIFAEIIFSERTPFDFVALRASVRALARRIADWDESRR
jgi:hypothetical protein